MEDGHDLKADLVISMQTLDIAGFKTLLISSSIELKDIIDHNSANIFHEIGLSSLPDSTELEFLEIIISFCYKKYEEKGSQIIKRLLNKQTNHDRVTPLMVATKNCKLVSKT